MTSCFEKGRYMKSIRSTHTCYFSAMAARTTVAWLAALSLLLSGCVGGGTSADETLAESHYTEGNVSSTESSSEANTTDNSSSDTSSETSGDSTTAPARPSVVYDDTSHPGTDIYYIGHGENKDRIIVIDAGHQKKASSDKEPVGPGSDILKNRVTQGATGAFTGTLEHELNLSVAISLRDALYARGYSVVMIRETAEVDISNKERSEIANAYPAALYIRIHANSFDAPSANGALTMCQSTANPYPGCAARYDESRRLSDLLLDTYCDAVGIRRRGVTESDNMTGLNWSEVPSTIVEMGFLSNEADDRLMSGHDFPALAAAGLANGIDAYFAASDNST